MNRPLALLRHLTALYVEDDSIQRADMQDLLTGFFRELVVTDNGEEALRLFESRPFQVLMADIRMPGLNGLELISRIRQSDRHIAIIIITAYADTADLLAATRLHLVDYVLKPVSWDRLKETLNRCATELFMQEYLFIQLDPDTLYCTADGDLRRAGEFISLTRHEKKLLSALAIHRGHWVSYDSLLTAIYTDTDTGTGTLKALKNIVLRLRHKLGTDLIENQYGVGYRMR